MFVHTAMALSVHVITLFPEMFPGPLKVSLVGKALAQGIWTLHVLNLRFYGVGAYQSVDDTCYGGGAGMVIRPDVVDHALGSLSLKEPHFLYMTPRGHSLKQKNLYHWSQKKELVFLCGRYEGVDERVIRYWSFEEVSLGDFVLCGGELAAMSIIEGCVRLLPNVIGDPASLVSESFQEDLLEYPHYTRPALWKKMSVPDVLLSGHHARIRQWRKDQSLKLTALRRPDLWQAYKSQHT